METRAVTELSYSATLTTGLRRAGSKAYPRWKSAIKKTRYQIFAMETHKRQAEERRVELIQSVGKEAVVYRK